MFDYSVGFDGNPPECAITNRFAEAGPAATCTARISRLQELSPPSKVSLPQNTDSTENTRRQNGRLGDKRDSEMESGFESDTENECGSSVTISNRQIHPDDRRLTNRGTDVGVLPSSTMSIEDFIATVMVRPPPSTSESTMDEKELKRLTLLLTGPPPPLSPTTSRVDRHAAEILEAVGSTKQQKGSRTMSDVQLEDDYAVLVTPPPPPLTVDNLDDLERLLTSIAACNGLSRQTSASSRARNVDDAAAAAASTVSASTPSSPRRSAASPTSPSSLPPRHPSLRRGCSFNDGSKLTRTIYDQTTAGETAAASSPSTSSPRVVQTFVDVDALPPRSPGSSSSRSPAADVFDVSTPPPLVLQLPVKMSPMSSRTDRRPSKTGPPTPPRPTFSPPSTAGGSACSTPSLRRPPPSPPPRTSSVQNSPVMASRRVSRRSDSLDAGVTRSSAESRTTTTSDDTISVEGESSAVRRSQNSSLVPSAVSVAAAIDNIYHRRDSSESSANFDGLTQKTANIRPSALRSSFTAPAAASVPAPSPSMYPLFPLLPDRPSTSVTSPADPNGGPKFRRSQSLSDGGGAGHNAGGSSSSSSGGLLSSIRSKIRSLWSSKSSSGAEREPSAADYRRPDVNRATRPTDFRLAVDAGSCVDSSGDDVISSASSRSSAVVESGQIWQKGDVHETKYDAADDDAVTVKSSFNSFTGLQQY